MSPLFFPVIFILFSFFYFVLPHYASLQTILIKAASAHNFLHLFSTYRNYYKNNWVLLFQCICVKFLFLFFFYKKIKKKLITIYLSHFYYSFLFTTVLLINVLYTLFLNSIKRFCGNHISFAGLFL